MGAQDAILATLRSLPAWSAAAQAAPWPAIIGSLPQAAWLVDGTTLRVMAANDAAHALLGRSAGSLVGEPADAVILTPEDMAYWDDARQGGCGVLDSETLLLAADGRSVRASRSIRPFSVEPGAARLFMVVLIDLSARHEVEERLEQALAELQATLESTADGLLVTDLNGRIRAFNRRFADIWAVPQALLAVRDDAAIHEHLRRQVDDPDGYDTRLRELVNGTLMTATDQLKLHTDKVIERVTQPLWHRGQPMGRVYAFRDLSERLEADRRIAELSNSDALTGLPNRAGLAAAVARACGEQQRQGGHFALMLVDLDRFGTINETLGAALADLVLVEIAHRLRGVLRQGDLVARVGGDQFALLIHGADPAAAEIAAQRILRAVSAPIRMDGMPFTLTCSVGVAVSPLHGHSLDELLSGAEEAMRHAKSSGRANWRMHGLRRAMDPRLSLRMDHAMRQALSENRFRLHFQPQIDMVSGSVVGAEALLRWRDPEFGGDVPPARFIPVAEESGLIVALGDWVMRQAVQQSADWLRHGLDMPVAVNVSALQFHQPGFTEQVADVLRQSRLPPGSLELEVTESILVHDADETLARLDDLARLGVRMSIDDFGTGYSSLAYLKRFPIQQVKIDRSFVAGLPADDSDAGIVTAIVQMARALGKDVIAEGVENPGQHQFLKQAGCTRFQGFLFAPALDPARFEERLRIGGTGAPRA